VGLSSGRTLKAEFYKRWIYRENACFPPACEEMDFSRGLVVAINRVLLRVRCFGL